MSSSILTEPQRISLVVVKMITGSLSVLGSGLLIFNSIRKLRAQESTTYHRLLLGMSVIDVIHSVFAGTLVSVMVPPESGGWGALGNWQTCSFQGWAIQLSTAVPLYNASLSIYFLMTIRHQGKTPRSSFAGPGSNQAVKWTAIQIAEPLFHLVPWTVGLVTAFLALARGWYNPLVIPEVGCWVDHYPAGCVESAEDEIECTRGISNAADLQRAVIMLSFWPLIAACSIVFVANVAIFVTVVIQERKLKNYGQSGNDSRSKEQIRTVAFQNFLYVLAMVNTVLWVLLADVAVYIGSIPPATIYPLHLLYVLTFPMQGFWNFLVYIRRRYLRLRRVYSMPWRSAFYRATFPDGSELSSTRAVTKRNSAQSAKPDHNEASDDAHIEGGLAGAVTDGDDNAPTESAASDPDQFFESPSVMFLEEPL